MLRSMLSVARHGRRPSTPANPLDHRLLQWATTDKANNWGRSFERVRVQREPRVGMATFDEPWSGPRSGYVALADWLLRKERPRW